MTHTPEATPLVGICVLNYHHPVETARCIESLLRREPPTTRILWIENDADSTRADMMAVLVQASFPWAFVSADSESLPLSGTIGIMLNGQNLGYAGGNNPGLRLLHKLGIPYAWVLNNDTELLEGSSADLVTAATSRPEVGAWGTIIHACLHVASATADLIYLGGSVSQKDFRIILSQSVQALETDPFAYVSGCSLFCRTSVFAEIGFIPDDYFLYYSGSGDTRSAGFQALKSTTWNPSRLAGAAPSWSTTTGGTGGSSSNGTILKPCASKNTGCGTRSRNTSSDSSSRESRRNGSPIGITAAANSDPPRGVSAGKLELRRTWTGSRHGLIQ